MSKKLSTSSQICEKGIPAANTDKEVKAKFSSRVEKRGCEKNPFPGSEQIREKTRASSRELISRGGIAKTSRLGGKNLIRKSSRSISRGERWSEERMEAEVFEKKNPRARKTSVLGKRRGRMGCLKEERGGEGFFHNVGKKDVAPYSSRHKKNGRKRGEGLQFSFI